VISADGKLSLSIHPCPDDVPSIFPILQSSLQKLFPAATFIVFCTHCQKLQNYSIEEDVALEAKGDLLVGMIAFSKIQISNALSYTGPPQPGRAILKKLIRNLSDKVTKIPC